MIPRRFAPAADAGATHVSLVAAALTDVDAGWFDTVLLGGAGAPPGLPDNVVCTYGMTETGSGVAYDGVPLDGVEIRTVDEEILVRAATLMRGYRDGTTSIDANGWLHTDDQGSWVDDQLAVVGRRGDVIVSGGEKVWPDPVERALLSCPGIADVVVIGLPDARWGQSVTAVVVADDRNRPTLATVREHTKKTLPAFMAPHSVKFVSEIPRTELGKVQRQKIKEIFAKVPR